MLCSGADPESYITEHALVYEEKKVWEMGYRALTGSPAAPRWRPPQTSGHPCGQIPNWSNLIRPDEVPRGG